MAVKFPTLEDLTAKMVTSLAGAGRSITDLAEKLMVRTLMLGVRDIVYEFILSLRAADEARSVFTARNDDLDQLCLEESATVRRRLETQAIVRFRLKKNAAVAFDTNVPAGSLITDQARLDFFTEAAVEIPAGQTSIEVDAKCAEPGIVGNLSPLSPVLPGMVGVDSVEVISVAKEGVDREDDETLRARLIEEMQNQEKGGTAPDYEIWAKRVTGVVSARAIPLARGNGTMDVIITGPDGLPTAALVAETQAYIDGKKPDAGCDALVKAPVPAPVDVTAEIRMATGYSFVDIKPLIEQALADCIHLENENLLVRISELSAAIRSVEGVFTFRLTAPAADVPLADDQLAVAGVFMITEVIA